MTSASALCLPSARSMTFETYSAQEPVSAVFAQADDVSAIDFAIVALGRASFGQTFNAVIYRRRVHVRMF
jgi:hypothetical protein